MAQEDFEKPPEGASIAVSGELLRVLRKAVSTMQLGVVVTDTEGRIVFVNPAQARMHGYEAAELLGREAASLAPETLQKRLQPDDIRSFRTWRRESVNRRKDGTLFPVMLLSDLVVDSRGEPIGIVTTAEDITERKRVEAELLQAREELEERVRLRTRELREANEALASEVAERKSAARALRESEARYRQLFERNLVAVCVTDLDGVILHANEALARLLGLASAEAAAGRGLAAFTPDAASFHAALWRVREEGTLSDVERLLVRADGSTVWVLESVSVLEDEDRRPTAVLWTAVDISARKRAEEQLLHDALHDPLTGLANRALFLDRLRQVAARSRRYGVDYAVLFADLDRFKLVNDSYGHDVGDRLLVAIAERLRRALRESDSVARLGGDEFTFLVEDVTVLADATNSARRILDALAAPVALESLELFTSASIGIAIGGPGTSAPEDLLRDADTAMYRAKALGKARYEVFDPAMRERAVASLRMETELRHALARGELRLHYQPIVELSDGHLTGFEALARWQHPERGMIQPDEFIPIAEETGLISAIGAWVLEEACRRLRAWQALFPMTPPLGMSVNLSSRQFSSDDLVQQIQGALDRTGLDPRTLTLEITESLLIENDETAAALLQRIRDLGVSLSLDDFGTGYSSLSYLHRLPLQKLKIDRSFIEGGDERTLEIVRAVAQLAESLQLEVIAEGVEGETAVEHLRAMHCASAQGFYYCEPADGEVLEGLLARAGRQSGGDASNAWVIRLPLRPADAPPA